MKSEQVAGFVSESMAGFIGIRMLFDDITSQPWFDPSDGAKEAFARYLIETFPSGAFDARKHRSVVEASARMFYSSDTAA